MELLKKRLGLVNKEGKEAKLSHVPLRIHSAKENFELVDIFNENWSLFYEITMKV